MTTTAVWKGEGHSLQAREEKRWEVEEKTLSSSMSQKGRHEEVLLFICQLVIKMTIHCDYTMDYCPTKVASACVSNTGRVKKNHHGANQHTMQWAGTGDTRRQKASIYSTDDTSQNLLGLP